MEPAQWTFLLDLMLTYGGPFLAFFFGVYISIRIGLNEETPGGHIWLMSFPVGLVAIGTLLTTTAVTVESSGVDQVYFGHMTSIQQFILFGGTVMFYGTLVPQLFHLNRSKLENNAKKEATGGG